MSTVKDPKSGKFKTGHRSPGRPAGSKNKLKIKDVLEDADKHSPEALLFLVKVMRGLEKGASVSNKQSAAIKILELAHKNKTDLEKGSEEDKAINDLVEDDTPIISLTAI